MILELIYHYLTIILTGDFTGHINHIHEDSPLLNAAYAITST